MYSVSMPLNNNLMQGYGYFTFLKNMKVRLEVMGCLSPYKHLKFERAITWQPFTQLDHQNFRRSHIFSPYVLTEHWPTYMYWSMLGEYPVNIQRTLGRYLNQVSVDILANTISWYSVDTIHTWSKMCSFYGHPGITCICSNFCC